MSQEDINLIFHLLILTIVSFIFVDALPFKNVTFCPLTLNNIIVPVKNDTTNSGEH